MARTTSNLDRHISRGHFLKQAAVAGASLAAVEAGSSLNPILGSVAQAAADPALSMWFFTLPLFNNYQTSLVKKFEAQNSGYKVTTNFTIPPVGTGGFEDRITLALATNTAPDVFPVITGLSETLISRHQLAPVDDHAAQMMGYKSIAEFKASRVAGALESVTDSSGTIYGGGNWDYNWYTLYINDQPLLNAGINPASVKLKTWDDLIKLGKAVVGHSKNRSFYYASNGTQIRNFTKLPIYFDDTWSMQTLTAFLAQTGGRVLNADGTQCVINQPAAVAAVRKMIEINRTSGISNPHVGAVVPGEMWTELATGHMTAGTPGPWFYGLFVVPSVGPKVGFHAHPLPMVGKQPGNVSWTWVWCVNAKSSNKDGAFTLIATLTSDPQGELATTGQWTPRPGFQNGTAARKQPYASIIWNNLRGSVNLDAMFGHNINYPKIARALRTRLEAMAYSGSDVQKTLDAAADEVNTILQG